MIHKCALAVIERRGLSVVSPSLTPLDGDEEDFLERHVDMLRATVESTHARGRFSPGSFLEADLARLLTADDRAFLSIAERHASALANAMEGTGNAKACVLALVTGGPGKPSETVSLLKLDAEVEAAQLRATEDGVRLRVLKELLPRPGELQKGFSWPDPRAPRSAIVVLDKVVAGSSTKYFRNAFELDVSPRAADTEDALARELVKLSAGSIAAAVQAADAGGDAEEVTERIRAVAPGFVSAETALGGAGALPGRIRPNFAARKKEFFEADGFELKVPLSALPQVETRRVGPGYVTTIRTSNPLTPVYKSVGAES